MANENLKSLVTLELLGYFKDKEDALVKSWDVQAVADANAYTDTEIGKVNTAAETLTGRVTAVETKSAANETAIGVLNGEGEGSVKKTVADEIAKVVAEAPESLDTLKEIADWIDGHGKDAAAMNTAIGNNKKAIEDLAALVGELPEEVQGTVVSYLAGLVSAEATRATGAEEALDGRLDTIEEALGDTGSIADAIATAKSEAIASAKDYSDGLDEAMDARVSALETDNTANKNAIDAINNTETGILATAKAYTDAEIVKVEAKVTANKNAIDAINDEATGAIATAESYTDTAIAALSLTGGAIKQVADDLSSYETATDARLDAVEAFAGAVATKTDIDGLFETVTD